MIPDDIRPKVGDVLVVKAKEYSLRQTPSSLLVHDAQRLLSGRFCQYILETDSAKLDNLGTWLIWY